MGPIVLQFQGIRNQQLLFLLLAAISLALAVYAVWQIVRGRMRSGVLALAAALSPAVMIPALLIDAVYQHLRGRRTAGNRSGLAGILLVVAVVIGGVLFVGAGYPPSALWMALLGIQVALAIGVFYSAVYAYLGTKRMTALMALRCAAILALLLILFKPAFSLLADEEASKPLLPILVDRSESMATEDLANAGTRYAQAIANLRQQRDRVGRSFRPLWYQFAESPLMAESLDALASLQPNGPGTEGTNLATAIRNASADARNLPGIVLLSDGIHNARDNVVDAAKEAAVPVYTVGLGSDRETSGGRRNIELVSVDAPLEAVKNNVTTITVRVKVTNFATVPADVQLVSVDGTQALDTQRLYTTKTAETLTAKLKWTPKDTGGAGGEGASPVRKLRVVIPTNPAESIREDNAAEIHVLVTEPRIRVLYVEGSMRPEYKYLKRLLDSDPNVQFMGLIRISGKTFWSQGSIGGRKLMKLPTADDEFALFDVLILGDLDRTFLRNEQMARTRRFVNDGGGLLMIGGHNSFGPGGYGGTDLEAVLPVEMGGRSQPQETTQFVPQLTAAGEAHPIFEGLSGYFFGPGGRKPDEKLPKLPELRGCVTVVRAKETAAVLALHPQRRNEAGPLTVLAVQRFGAGRSAAFTADTTWQWYMHLRALGTESPYHRFWGQLIRWLANVETKRRDAMPSVVMRLDASYVPIGRPVRILARVQDEKGRGAENAQVSCTITSPTGGGEGETVPLSPRREPGVYEATHRPQGEGSFRLTVSAVDAAGRELGSDELALHVAPHSAERERSARNEKLLREIADHSRGRYADISALPDLIDQIIDRQKASVPETPQAEPMPLYHFAGLFIAFVLLLTGEWVLRRSWQLH